MSDPSDLPFVNEDSAITDVEAFHDWTLRNLRLVYTDEHGNQQEVGVDLQRVRGHGFVLNWDGSMDRWHDWYNAQGVRELVTEHVSPPRPSWWRRIIGEQRDVTRFGPRRLFLLARWHLLGRQRRWLVSHGHRMRAFGPVLVHRPGCWCRSEALARLFRDLGSD